MSQEAKVIDDTSWVLQIQIRFKYFENIEKSLMNNVIKLLSNFNKFLNKEEIVKNSLNLYYSNLSISKKIVKTFEEKYFCEIKHSKKIMGRNSLTSKDLYRHFVNINILNLKKGNELFIKNIKYKINSIDGKKLYLRNLENGNKKCFSYHLIKEYIRF